MADETVIISNLPTHTPAGSDYLAIENSTETGKNTVNNIVAAAQAVQTNTQAIGTLSSLTTDAKDSLVAAVNEVDSHTDTNTAAISQLNSNFSSNIGLYNPDTDNLSTSLSIISFRSVSYNNNTNAFGTSTDGGVLCKKAGVVKILGIVRSQNLNASDVVNVAAGIYRNGSWATEAYGFRASGATAITNVAASVMNVQANDIVYLRVANETASRGKLSGGSVIWVNYV